MSRNVLLASSSQTIFVLDIPTSIEDGQGAGRLCSAAAPKLPYLTPEPKGRTREALLAKLPADELAYHRDIQHGIEMAFANVCDLSQWCLPRIVSNLTELSVLVPATESVEIDHNIPVVLSTGLNHFKVAADIQNVLVSSNNEQSLVFLNDKTTLLIPPSCHFIWSSISHAYLIMESYEALTRQHLKFDLILMDPPWANRSVRNSRSYSTIDYRSSDVFLEALKIVKHCHASHAYTAIWITNKHTIRKHVLKSMQDLRFTLVEEWVWVKVTTKGEPVMSMDGLWRKPYELLLIFQHDIVPCTPLRRHIFAVPDLHSRKPNLRTLFDMIAIGPRRIELFARNLTSQWWCVGDEVLKYQDTNLWRIAQIVPV